MFGEQSFDKLKFGVFVLSCVSTVLGSVLYILWNTWMRRLISAFAVICLAVFFILGLFCPLAGFRVLKSESKGLKLFLSLSLVQVVFWVVFVPVGVQHINTMEAVVNTCFDHLGRNRHQQPQFNHQTQRLEYFLVLNDSHSSRYSCIDGEYFQNASFSRMRASVLSLGILLLLSHLAAIVGVSVSQWKGRQEGVRKSGGGVRGVGPIAVGVGQVSDQKHSYRNLEDEAAGMIQIPKKSNPFSSYTETPCQ